MLGTLIQDRFPSDSETVQALGEWKLPETLQRLPEAEQRLERLASRNGYIHHIPMAWLLLALEVTRTVLYAWDPALVLSRYASA